MRIIGLNLILLFTVASCFSIKQRRAMKDYPYPGSAFAFSDSVRLDLTFIACRSGQVDNLYFDLICANHKLFIIYPETSERIEFNNEQLIALYDLERECIYPSRYSTSYVRIEISSGDSVVTFNPYWEPVDELIVRLKRNGGNNELS